MQNANQLTSLSRDAVLHNTRETRWLLEEFTLAHTHSKNQNGNYLVTLMLDDIKSSEIKDANLKNHVETNTFLSCKDLVRALFHIYGFKPEFVSCYCVFLFHPEILGALLSRLTFCTSLYISLKFVEHICFNSSAPHEKEAPVCNAKGSTATTERAAKMWSSK